jgi:HK97 gp10 family phage protein
MKVEWHPAEITIEVEKRAMGRLEKAGEVVADKARGLVPAPPSSKMISRPPHGKPWTERIPGTLKKSIRVRRLDGDPKLDVRVYAGARQSDKLTAYYAHFVEFGTVKMKAQPFLRPALSKSRSAIKNIVENG